jgi:DNA segregation ATPase FtsK/SpoIIIE-like protein
MKSAQTIKNKAKKMIKISKDLGCDIKLGHMLEILSRYECNQSWNVVSSKSSNPKDVDIESLINNLDKFKDKFFLGIQENNEPLVKNFMIEPNALFAGSLGGGKSNSIRVTLLLWLLANKNKSKVYIVDLIKGSHDFQDFLDLDSCKAIIKQNKFKDLIDNLYQDIKERSDLLKDNNVNNITEYETLTGKKLNRNVLVLKEFHSILVQVSFNNNVELKETTAYKMNYLIRNGRALGFWFISSTQRSTESDIPERLLANFCNKQAFKISSTESKYIIGNENASKLTNSDIGSCYTDFGKVRFPKLNDDKLKQIIRDKLK